MAQGGYFRAVIIFLPEFGGPTIGQPALRSFAVLAKLLAVNFDEGIVNAG